MPASDAKSSQPPLRLRLIACEIFYRELCACVASSHNIVDIDFLTQGLHDLRHEKMADRIQSEINSTDAGKYAAILLGFGLCNNGTEGLSHPSLPLVIPRSHDCIALFMGSRPKYDAYFAENPGTFYKTSGWVERDHVNLEDCSEDSQSPFGPLRTFEAYVERYGEENARFLMETLGTSLQNYTRMAYIDQPELGSPPYAEETRDSAKKMGLEFDQVEGDMSWLCHLVNGPWEESEFLIVPPGKRIRPSYDESVLKSE